MVLFVDGMYGVFALSVTTNGALPSRRGSKSGRPQQLGPPVAFDLG